MITEEEYNKFIINQQKLFTEDMIAAIEEQTRLSKIAHEKQAIRDAIDAKSRNLVSIGHAKLKEKYPEIENKLSQKETRVEAMNWIIREFLSNSENYRYVHERMQEIPEFQEDSKLQDDLGKANYEYFNAIYELNKKMVADRKKFFTEPYIAKMDEYANKGLLLYFLETPDIDLLDEKLDENFLIDTFLFAHCLNLKILLDRYVNIPNPSPIMSRKGEDIFIAISLLEAGYYRAAARNFFALLESEHKRCADAFNGYFTKKQELRKGHERAKKIADLLDKINMDWEKHSWEKINNYYKKVFSTEKSYNVCYRNGIIHGDYPDDAIDTSAGEVVKLVLMWLNLRVLADSLSILEDSYDNLLSYGIGWAINKES